MVLHHVHHAVNFFNNNTLITGIMLLVLNIGGRHISNEFSPSEKLHSENIILRRLAVFAVCFVGTKDFVISVILTAAFVILASGIYRNIQKTEKMANRVTVAYGGAQDRSPPMFLSKYL